MARPQPGIFAHGTRAHRHIEYDLRPGVTPATALAHLATLRQPSTSAGGANIVVGFGPAFWHAATAAAAAAAATPAAITVATPPTGLRDLAVAGVESTAHDLWFWIHGTDDGTLFDVARGLHQTISPVATLANETHGFAYRDGRDLTGFIDGTENPSVEEAHDVAIVAHDRPGAGGSYALVQRWVHDLDAFHSLSLDEQQRVIGRTKPDSIELGSTEATAPDEADAPETTEAAAEAADSSQEPRSPDAPTASHAQGPPPTSHVGRVVVESPDGTELEIYRRSIPYGNLTEAGLMFVAFSADPTRVETMLNRMFGNTDDGLLDSLTRFSTPVSTAVYFVPSLEELGDILG